LIVLRAHIGGQIKSLLLETNGWGCWRIESVCCQPLRYRQRSGHVPTIAVPREQYAIKPAPNNHQKHSPRVRPACASSNTQIDRCGMVHALVGAYFQAVKA